MRKQKKKDPLGRRRDIIALRKKLVAQLPESRVVFGNLSPEYERVLANQVEFADFKRVDHERQLEAIKETLNPYIFNPNLVVRTTEVDASGNLQVIELTRFETMLKAIPLYLAALNIQNKMWGINVVPAKDPSGPREPPNDHGREVEELRLIARRERPALDNGIKKTE